MDTELTKAERIAAINEMALLYKRALDYECTCYSKPEETCSYCLIMSKADKLHADAVGD